MRFNRKEKGFTLTEVIMVVGIGAMLTMGIGSVIISSVEMQKKANSLNGLESFRMNLIKSISDPVAMKLTMLTNPGMTCLVGTGPCNANIDGPFTLRGPAGVIYDGLNSSQGLTLDGAPCTGFSASGSDACPFRYNLTWRAVCSGNPPPVRCANPAVVVNAMLQHSPADVSKKGAVNLDRYSVKNAIINPMPCQANSQVVINNGTTAMSGAFTTPSDYDVLVVEAIGGGGGGAAVTAQWTGCQGPYPGQPGGPTNFLNMSAAGGPAGQWILQGGNHYWIWCIWSGWPVCGAINWGDCSGGGLSVVGGRGQAPSAAQQAVIDNAIPTPLRACISKVKVGGGSGGQGCQQGGSPGGGGGAGSCPVGASAVFAGGGWAVVTGAYSNGGEGSYIKGMVPGVCYPGSCSCWWFWCWCSPGFCTPPTYYWTDASGGYAQGIYTSNTALYPGYPFVGRGVSIPYNIGQGGAGALGMAGNGAPGMIKFTWW